jgi:hypothetical protein
MNLRQISAEKRAIIKRIIKRITPHLWESGYVTGPVGDSRPLKLWVEHRNLVRKTFRINGVMISAIEGIAEDSVIIDGEGGGIVTTPFVDLPIEDLIRVEQWTIKKFSEAR